MWVMFLLRVEEGQEQRQLCDYGSLPNAYADLLYSSKRDYSGHLCSFMEVVSDSF